MLNVRRWRVGLIIFIALDLDARWRRCGPPLEQVLGFESASNWSTTTTGVTLGLSSTHTQGTSSLSVKPSSSNGWTPLQSVPLSSLGAVSPSVAVDLDVARLSKPIPTGSALQMYINIPSRTSTAHS